MSMKLRLMGEPATASEISSVVGTVEDHISSRDRSQASDYEEGRSDGKPSSVRSRGAAALVLGITFQHTASRRRIEHSSKACS